MQGLKTNLPYSYQPTDKVSSTVVDSSFQGQYLCPSLSKGNMEDTTGELIYIRLVVPGPIPFSFGPAMYLMNLKLCHPLESVICTNTYGLLQPPFCASAAVISVQGPERITEETDNYI